MLYLPYAGFFFEAMVQFCYPLKKPKPKLVQHSLFYDWSPHFNPFGFGGTVMPLEEEGHNLNKSMKTLLVEQPMALPGIANYTPSPLQSDTRVYY